MSDGMRAILALVVLFVGTAVIILAIRLTDKAEPPGVPTSVEGVTSPRKLGRLCGSKDVPAQANPYVSKEDRVEWLKGWIEWREVPQDKQDKAPAP